MKSICKFDIASLMNVFLESDLVFSPKGDVCDVLETLLHIHEIINSKSGPENAAFP